jgi:uncharacterized protein DUF6933
VVLWCTKKLLAVLGAGRVTEPGPAPDVEDWYANLLWFDRRKCMLLTHAAILFSVFDADVRAAELRVTRRLVTELVERELRREGLPAETFGDLRSQELTLAKTADRSVPGCMNDMAFLCEVAISDAGGLAQCDLGELNRALHRNINGSRGYRPPVELATRRLERAIHWTRNRPTAGATQLAAHLELPPGSTLRSVAEQIPPKHSVAADRRGYGTRLVGPRRARNRTICGGHSHPGARMVVQP